MKTGYKATMKSLAEIIGNTYLDIQFKDETHSSYKACLHECKTNDLGYIVVIYGYGKSVEDACEKLFRNLLGTTLIQEGGEETNFNMVLDKYRNSKKKKINNYPTLKECKKIISDNKYHKILITVLAVEKEIIKGHELLIIKDSDEKTYYAYDNYLPEDEEIEEYDDILIYYHIAPQYREYIASKLEIISKYWT